MKIKTFFMSAATLAILTSSADAQGRPDKQIVISKAVLKSMVANKPKSKTQLARQVGMVRRSGVVAAKSDVAQPTSVRQISPAAKH